MKKFEEFIKNGIVKRQGSNINRALSLIKEAEDKKSFLELAILKIPKEKMNPNFIIDSCYDILMELIRAKMFSDGFNAGNSHEAEVSYLSVLGFGLEDLEFMDELRYHRNGTKYYGTILTKEYAVRVLDFLNKNYIILKNKLK
jgi:hypothetical protein